MSKQRKKSPEKERPKTTKKRKTTSDSLGDESATKMDNRVKQLLEDLKLNSIDKNTHPKNNISFLEITLWPKKNYNTELLAMSDDERILFFSEAIENGVNMADRYILVDIVNDEFQANTIEVNQVIMFSNLFLATCLKYKTFALFTMTIYEEYITLTADSETGIKAMFNTIIPHCNEYEVDFSDQQDEDRLNALSMICNNLNLYKNFDILTVNWQNFSDTRTQEAVDKLEKMYQNSRLKK